MLFKRDTIESNLSEEIENKRGRKRINNIIISFENDVLFSLIVKNNND